MSATQAVLLDFYGTVARATSWVSADEVLAEHGYQLEPELFERWYNDGIDGIAHDEHSQSRETYVAWQRQRTLAMLAETDVHPGEYEEILEKLRAGSATRTIEAYDEAPEVLDALRARGLRLVICSNWDWDLREAIDEAGLTDHFDAVVSSAWVGARKPHPRIYAQALAEARVERRRGALRRRHLGSRCRGAARRRDPGRLPPPRRPLARRHPAGRRARCERGPHPSRPARPARPRRRRGRTLGP